MFLILHQALIIENLNGNIKFFGRIDNRFHEIFAIYVADKKLFFDAVDKVASDFESKISKREIGLDVFAELKKVITGLIALSENTDDYDIVQKYNLMRDLYSNKITIDQKINSNC